MRPQHFLALLVFCLALTGCTARGPLKATPSEEPNPSTLAFSERLGALPDGSTQYFNESPFGPATIDVGQTYLSGLGNECRSARATQSGMSHRFALCLEEGGKWRFIPTIFEGMLR